MPRDILKIECRNATRDLGIPSENVTFLSYPVRSFSEHRQKILDDLLQLRRTIKPDLVLAPSSHDMHQDHGVICHETLRAFKKESSIWGYEHPWNNLNFTAGVFVKLTQGQLEKKICALSEYKSQGNRGYMAPRNICAQVYTHGVQMGIDQAEAFELTRLIY
jgi:LmbE family N-acetylglucosaminyl deacetylase